MSILVGILDFVGIRAGRDTLAFEGAFVTGTVSEVSGSPGVLGLAGVRSGSGGPIFVGM